jgi:response regulator RpfG family c-di-GMP phosphodiesterase
MTYKLLIVDDELANTRLLERLFRQDYFCLTASSGEEAMEILDQHEVAVIITDQRMPQMTGVELLKRSADRRPHMVRILLTGYTDLEALVEAVNCGLVYMYVSKPWNNDDLKLRVSRAVQHYETNKRQHLLAANNERLNSRIKEMKLGFIRAMASVLQLKNDDLYAHGSRVSKYANVLGEKLGLNVEVLLDLTAAAFLHELGEITGAQLFSHKRAESAAQIVGCISEFKEAADIIRYQFENFDGSGNPLGLIGEQIPIAARVLRVVKEFDLLTRDAAGTAGLTPNEAFQRMQSNSGREFDPRVLMTFSELVSQTTDLSQLTAVPVNPEMITHAIN